MELNLSELEPLKLDTIELNLSELELNLSDI